jgi:hypothetical protein
LNKAKPAERAAYLERLKGLLDEALQGRCLWVYIDEAHIHLDTDEGYGWSIYGERFWVSSSSPGRAKVSFYGVYLYNLGQVRIFSYDKADQFNTIDVLKRLRVEFPDMVIKLIWTELPITGLSGSKQQQSCSRLSWFPYLPTVLISCRWSISGSGCEKMSLITPATTSPHS